MKFYQVRKKTTSADLNLSNAKVHEIIKNPSKTKSKKKPSIRSRSRSRSRSRETKELIPTMVPIQARIPTSTPTLVPPVPSIVKMTKPRVPNPFATISDLFRAIHDLLGARQTSLRDPIFRFDITPEAAASNLDALQKHKFNLTKLCNGQDKTATSYGSEFKNVELLDQLLKKVSQMETLPKGTYKWRRV